MDSATVGIPQGYPEYYNILTKWNMRLTWSGEFIHSAPWSTSAQGTANVSHGCTHMAPADAEWMYNPLQDRRRGRVHRLDTAPLKPPRASGVGLQLRRLEGPDRPGLTWRASDVFGSWCAWRR